MTHPARQRVLALFGTRPEAIKLAPVVRALRARPERFECLAASTGQHRELVARALDAFGLAPDVQLDAMASAGSLGRLTARLFGDLDGLLESARPDWVVVQGDTTSAMVGAVAAFYRRIKVAHVEAGLRTGDRHAPFPEEVNRTFIGRVADLHFAPTPRAAANLRAEGVDDSAVLVTGNTAVDALLWAAERLGEAPPAGLGPELLAALEGRRLVLATCHRRESFGPALEGICRALGEVARRHPDVVVAYPVHPNPSVREPAHRLLGGEPRVALLDPLPYPAMVWLLRRCHCVLTDSGGLQEEAPTFGKPVLVLRDATERPEAVEAGCARLVGVSAGSIVAAAAGLLGDPSAYRAMSGARNPFGDGRAGLRIADALAGPGPGPGPRPGTPGAPDRSRPGTPRPARR
jgi:UDP-N-acetylglucosamine 2-epimerase